MSFVDNTLAAFDTVSEGCFARLQADEDLTLNLAAEDQHYLRFNNASVRQSTRIEQRRLTLQFQAQARRVVYRFDLTGAADRDAATALSLIERARQEAAVLPEDPFVTPDEHHGCSEEHHSGKLPALSSLLEQITAGAAGTDFTGLYAAGPQLRATRNLAGLRHVFSTESLFLDYSLFAVNPAGENKAVKGLLAGRNWQPEVFAAAIAAGRERLVRLRRESHPLAPGQHRVFLAPAAVDALITMLSWGGVSYGAWKKGDSALSKLIEGKVRLSPRFRLAEDFGLGLAPRFNSLGEVAPGELTVIADGGLQNLLISTRSAREYGVHGNGADTGEGLRSPVMGTGDLDEADVLRALDTGVYVSNLHYLNWSDLQSARITGMTRYACFWVERGEIVGPIRDMRFDESLYRILGDALEAVTTEASVMMNTATYGQRSLGGSQAPGLLLSEFRFTL